MIAKVGVVRHRAGMVPVRVAAEVEVAVGASIVALATTMAEQGLAGKVALVRNHPAAAGVIFDGTTGATSVSATTGASRLRRCRKSRSR